MLGVLLLLVNDPEEAKTGFLARAGGGQEEHLALVDEVGVADGRIGAGDAQPEGGVAELTLRDGPECVAAAHSALGGGAKRGDGGGKNNRGADFDEIGIAHAWINFDAQRPRGRGCPRRGHGPKVNHLYTVSYRRMEVKCGYELRTKSDSVTRD